MCKPSLSTSIEYFILINDWLGREQFSIKKVDNSKTYFPLYSDEFVQASKRIKEKVKSWPRFIC